MAGQNNFIIGLALITIFAIAMMNFAVNFGEENAAPINIYNDSDISSAISDSESEMTTFSAVGNSSEGAFAQASIDETSQSGTLVTGSPFKSTYKNPVNVMKSMMNLGYKKIFGADANFNVIFSTILTVVLVIGFLLVWKTWKGGNPE